MPKKNTILAQCSFEESLNLRGNLKITTEETSETTGKVTQRNKKVMLLPLHTLDDTQTLQSVYEDGGVRGNTAGYRIDYRPDEGNLPSGAESGRKVPIIYELPWFGAVDEWVDEIKNPLVRIIYRIPDNQFVSASLFELVDACREHKNIRFYGGKSGILNVSGMRIGYFDDAEILGDKPSKQSVYYGPFDFGEIVDLESVREDIVESAVTVPKRKVSFTDLSKSGAKKPRASKPQEPAKVKPSGIAAMSSLLGSKRNTF